MKRSIQLEYTATRHQAMVTKVSPSLNNSNFLPLIIRTQHLSLKVEGKECTTPKLQSACKKTSYGRAS